MTDSKRLCRELFHPFSRNNSLLGRTQGLLCTFAFSGEGREADYSLSSSIVRCPLELGSVAGQAAKRLPFPRDLYSCLRPTQKLDHYFNTAAAWVVERTTTIRGSHFYNHMFRLCSVSFLLFPYYAGAPRAPLFPLLCRHIVRLPTPIRAHADRGSGNIVYNELF